MTATKTAAEILAEAEDPSHLRVETAYVLQRQDLYADYEQARTELAAARRRHGDVIGNAELSDLQQRLAAAEEAMAGALIEYKFRNVGHRGWADLLAACPPTKEQRAKYPGADHNPDKFKPALLALACVEPEGTDVEFFERLARVYSPDQFEALWLACYTANMGGSALPKVLSRTRGLRPRMSEESESTPAAEESLDPSSSDG